MRTDLLRTLATNFGSNSVLAAKAIREIYVLDSGTFAAAAAEVLQGPELAGSQFLVAILLAEPEWLRAVCDPEKYTLDQSLDLVRRANKLDPQTGLKLAEMLVPLGFSTDAEARFASRVFAVLKRSPPSTVLPALRRLSKCPNARLRSKAVLLMGHIYQNPNFALSEGERDPRVSANAVESLWGLATPAAREAFLKASRDQNHRIAANGIVGLYQMGDESAVPLLFRLSKSEVSLSRAAAAWAMGYVEDPRFLPGLTRLMEDADPVTRQRAFRAAAQLRQRTTELRDGGVLRVQFREIECRGSAHTIRVHIGVHLNQEDQFVKGLDARQFVIWNGPDVVEEFSLSLSDGAAPYYEITYQNPPSPTHLVKVQVYAAVGVGEESGTATSLSAGPDASL